MFYKRSSLQLFMTALVASLFLFSSTAQSEITYPVDDNSFVIDDVGVLNLTEAQELEQLSIDLSDGWGTDIVVVLIESTNNYTTENDTNMSLAQYTIQLFDAWGVGNQEWKDGVLIVLAINQTGSWEWSYEYGLFWQEEYRYIFDEWYDRIPDSVDEDMAAGDWANALYPLVVDLSWSIDDFWYENDGWVDPPAEQQQQDWSTPPVLDGQADEDLSSGDTLVGILCCFGGLGVLGLIGFLLLRGGSGGGGGRSNGRYYGGNNHYGHHPQDVGFQQNNYYGGGFNDTPAQQQQQPQVSGGNKRSRKASGGSQRGSSTKRSGSSRSGGGSSRGGSSGRSSGGSSRSSRGGSSGRSSGGGSRRSGGGGGRRGGGRRGR